MKRVVITGMGTVNPLGKNVSEFWENIVANKNGLSFVDQFDATDFPVKIVGAVKDFDSSAYIEKKEARSHMKHLKTAELILKMLILTDAELLSVSASADLN